MGDAEQQAELASFLRPADSRSTRRPPAYSAGRRRTPGLRRAEVSLLSGVSLTWYTWLEQARDISPSAQVIDALARTLQLSDAQHQCVLRRADHRHQPPSPEDDQQLPAHGQRLLAALGDSPAYAITPAWHIVGWNEAYEAFSPSIATVPDSERNLLWLVLTDSRVPAHASADCEHRTSGPAGTPTTSSSPPLGSEASSIHSKASCSSSTTGWTCPTAEGSTRSSTPLCPAAAPAPSSRTCAHAARPISRHTRASPRAGGVSASPAVRARPSHSTAQRWANASAAGRPPRRWTRHGSSRSPRRPLNSAWWPNPGRPLSFTGRPAGRPPGSPCSATTLVPRSTVCPGGDRVSAAGTSAGAVARRHPCRTTRAAGARRRAAAALPARAAG